MERLTQAVAPRRFLILKKKIGEFWVFEFNFKIVSLGFAARPVAVQRSALGVLVPGVV